MDELENKEQSLQEDTRLSPAETKTEPEAVLELAGEFTAESEAAAEEPATDAQTPPQNEAAPAMEDALVQELEGIRDLLQQELDKAGEEPLIQALDETQEEPQEDEAIPEEKLCTCCGERRRDTSFGEDYPYCTECREVMKASGLRVPAVLMLLLTFVLAGAALYFSAMYIADYSTLMEAEMHYEARELSDAAALYSTYISQKSGADLQNLTSFQDAYSVTAVKQLAKTFSDMGYLGDANEVLTTYLGEKALKRPWNKAYLAMTEEYAALSKTSSAINEIMQDILYYGETDVDFEERDAQLQALELEKDEDGNPVHNAAFVEFYRYVLLNVQNAPNEEQLKQLQLVQQLDENRHPWMYLSTMADLSSKLGDVEGTKAYVEDCLAINKQEAAAYKSLANVYRFQKKPDAEKILAVAEDAKAHLASSAGSAPTYQEQFAVGYLLQGDYEKAMQAMEDYMSFTTSRGTPAYSVSSCNLYALCSILCNNQEGYDEMAQVLASAGMAPSKLIKQFQKGKITMVELLQDDGGEF